MTPLGLPNLWLLLALLLLVSPFLESDGVWTRALFSLLLLTAVYVARQYSGTAGRIENCRVGVFLAYASCYGQALIDRRLYLPEAWAEDAARRQKAQVPEAVEFATKPAIARNLITSALDAGVPCAWVLADALYGSVSRLRRMLEKQGPITRSYSALLSHHPSMVPWVARDPTAWNRWEYESQLSGILRAGTLADPAAELAVRNYLVAIPRTKAQIANQ